MRRVISECNSYFPAARYSTGNWIIPRNRLYQILAVQSAEEGAATKPYLVNASLLRFSKSCPIWAPFSLLFIKPSDCRVGKTASRACVQCQPIGPMFPDDVALHSSPRFQTCFVAVDVTDATSVERWRVGGRDVELDSGTRKCHSDPNKFMLAGGQRSGGDRPRSDDGRCSTRRSEPRIGLGV
jgi:hypothetical protein